MGPKFRIKILNKTIKTRQIIETPPREIRWPIIFFIAPSFLVAPWSLRLPKKLAKTNLSLKFERLRSGIFINACSIVELNLLKILTSLFMLLNVGKCCGMDLVEIVAISMVEISNRIIMSFSDFSTSCWSTPKCTKKLFK